MRLFIITTIFYAVASMAIAQTVSQNGTITFQNGDQLVGHINLVNSEICQFRVSPDDPIREYSPTQIKSLQFDDGTRYMSMLFGIGDEEPAVQFIELLVEGQVSLFALDNQFFVRKNNDNLIQLVNTRSEVETEDGKKGFKERNEYIGILNYYMTDCNDIRSDITKVKISEKLLTRLVIKYNRCVGAEFSESRSNVPFSKIDYGAFVGISKKDHQIREQMNRPIYPNGSYGTIGPQIGFNIEWSSPRTSQHVFLRLSPNLQYFYGKGSTLQGSPMNGSQYELTMSYAILNLPAGVKIDFSTGEHKFFLNGGVAYNLYFANKLEAEKALIIDGNVFLSNEALPLQVAPMSTWFGGGYHIKSLAGRQAVIEVRYETSSHEYEQTDEPLRFYSFATQTTSITISLTLKL